MSSYTRFFIPISFTESHDQKMILSDKFVAIHGDELLKSVRLMVPNGRIWTVRLEKDEKGVWLRDGLQKFMEDNLVGASHFLMFKYLGNSMFKLNIFDNDHHEIEYPSSAYANDTTDADDDNNNDNDNDDSLLEILGSTANDQPRGTKRRTVERGEEKGRDSSTRRQRKIREDRSKMLVVGSSNGTNRIGSRKMSSQSAGKPLPENGSYKVTLKPYNKHHLALPASFAQAHLSGEGQFVTLQDVNDKEWKVKCNVYTQGTCALTKGWMEFSRENHLKPRDVYILEPSLINGEVKIKVKKLLAQLSLQ